MGKTCDLTIDDALHDPLIAAVMRADRVNPLAFEQLLRSAQRRLEQRERRPVMPAAVAARALSSAFCCRPSA